MRHSPVVVGGAQLLMCSFWALGPAINSDANFCAEFASALLATHPDCHWPEWLSKTSFSRGDTLKTSPDRRGHGSGPAQTALLRRRGRPAALRSRRRGTAHRAAGAQPTDPSAGAG